MGMCDMPGEFHLTATLDSSGMLIGGTLTTFGAIPDIGFPSVSALLTGNLQQFAYTPTDLEFTFNVIGTSLASLYGGIGALGDIEISNLSGFNLASNFSGLGDATADVNPVAAAAVPEPATLLLFATGLIGVVGSRYIRR